jgi:hypothetical protein
MRTREGRTQEAYGRGASSRRAKRWRDTEAPQVEKAAKEKSQRKHEAAPPGPSISTSSLGGSQRCGSKWKSRTFAAIAHRALITRSALAISRCAYSLPVYNRIPPRHGDSGLPREAASRPDRRPAQLGNPKGKKMAARACGLDSLLRLTVLRSKSQPEVLERQ